MKETWKKTDKEYREEKQSEMNKAEERKQKQEETRKDRETGWNVAHVDEWSDEEALKKSTMQAEKAHRATGRTNKNRRRATYIKNKTNRESSKEKG